VTGARLLISCLEREGVRYVFGVPGEETLALNDALLDSSVRFVSVRLEQAAAFMADVWGRLTGRAGVCLATLGPGATNLATGLADATLDRAPVVAITGQLARSLLHKESVRHIVEAFRPFTKWNTQIETGAVIPRGRAQGLQGRRGGEAWGLPHGDAGGCSRGGCRG
jgi:acetolactate synthase I/II/III large subunit